MNKENIFWLIMFILLIIGFIVWAVRPHEAEFNHCQITSTDKSICESLK